MSDLNYSRAEKLFPQAARVLESRLYPQPPSCDELRNTYSLSNEYNQKILSLSKIISAKKSRSKSLKTFFLIAAIIAVLVAFSLCMAAKEGNLLSMITVDFHKPDGTLNYTELHSDKGNFISDEFNRVVFPEYIPEGFVRDVSYRSSVNEQFYTNGDKSFLFRQSPPGSATLINTEKYDMHQLQIGDNIAYYFEVPQHDYVFVTLECRFGRLAVCGSLTLEECIKVLESVK